MVGLITCGLFYYFQKQLPEISKVSEKEITKSKEATTIPQSEKFEMLIFISPQYADDLKIKEAINAYIQEVKRDINWDTKIITLTSSNNDFRKIDGIIENYHLSNGIKAAIMVGEDINTALGTEGEGWETPSITPWATLEEYDVHKGLIVMDPEPEQIDIVISLLYPTHVLNYTIKSQQIIDVFKKFSSDRNKRYPQNFLAFLDKGMATHNPFSTEDYKGLAQYGTLDYKEFPSQQEILDSFMKNYMMYSLSGHGDPGHVWLGNKEETVYSIFNADQVNLINTPIITVGGCNVGGWYGSYNTPNQKLDYSTNKSWFGSKIFTNSNLRVMILGAPHQVCANKTDLDFFAQAMPELMAGRTLAESLVGKKLCDPFDATIYGDPTFRYNF